MAERKFKIGETVRNSKFGQLYRIVSVRSERKGVWYIEVDWRMDSASRLRRKPICRQLAGAARERRQEMTYQRNDAAKARAEALFCGLVTQYHNEALAEHYTKQEAGGPKIARLKAQRLAADANGERR